MTNYKITKKSEKKEREKSIKTNSKNKLNNKKTHCNELILCASPGARDGRACKFYGNYLRRIFGQLINAIRVSGNYSEPRGPYLLKEELGQQV